jgi:grpE
VKKDKVETKDTNENVSEELNETSTEERPQEVEKEAAETISEEESCEEKEKDARDIKIEELNDRLIRNMAEFDNFRKRSEKEKQSMFDMGARSIAEKLLPVVDNFERGLKTVPEDKEAKLFFDGMDMIYKQLLKNLEEAGVKAIDCVGKEFNPDFHNAVMHVEDESLGENTVVEELQKGYMYKDSVLRYSMVKVAN